MIIVRQSLIRTKAIQRHSHHKAAMTNINHNSRLTAVAPLLLMRVSIALCHRHSFSAPLTSGLVTAQNRIDITSDIKHTISSHSVNTEQLKLAGTRPVSNAPLQDALGH